MKIAYIVRGSEDGNIGVYSTKERARKRAVEYVEQSGGENARTMVTRKSWKDGDDFTNKYHYVVANQSNVSKELDKTMHVSIDANDVEADIEAFYVNQ
jgi:hypothetical protein